MILKKRTAINTLAVAVVIVLIVIAGAGAYYFLVYSPSTTTTTTTPLTGSLNLITFTDPSNAWLKWAATQFEALHPGVTINIVAQGFSQYANTEATSLQTGSNTYDIITYTSTSALRFLPWVVPLNNVITLNSSDIPGPQLAFGGLYRNATTGVTQTIGVPYDTSTFAIFYRTDIFDSPTLNSSFYNQYHVSLDPNKWTSWQNLLEADNFLVNQTKTVPYGIIFDADQSHDIIDTFPAIYGSYYSQDSSVNGGNPQGGLTNWGIMFKGSAAAGKNPAPSFNSTSGVQALQLFYQAVKYDPQPFTEVNYGTVFVPLQSGQAAGALMFTADATSLPNSTINGKYGVATLPGGYAETGTDFYAVSKYSSNQPLAEAFLAYLITPKVNAEIYYQAQEFPISKAAVHLIDANQSLPQWQRTIVDRVFQTGAEGWANPPNLTITSTQLIPAFNQPIYNFLTTSDGSSTAALQALNNAAAAWAKAVG